MHDLDPRSHTDAERLHRYREHFEPMQIRTARTTVAAVAGVFSDTDG